MKHISSIPLLYLLNMDVYTVLILLQAQLLSVCRIRKCLSYFIIPEMNIIGALISEENKKFISLFGKERVHVKVKIK